MSETGKNTLRRQRLLSIGAVWPELLEEIADLLESKDSTPHVSCFFQLPYPLHADRAWHRVRGSREDPNLYFHLQARLARIQFDEFARSSIRELPLSETIDGATVTQIIALIPLWGLRARFYSEYARCVSGEDLVNRIVVPREYSWIEHRAISAADFEFNLVSRLTRLIMSGLRFFLPSYSISSLLEAPLPDALSNYFTMPFPERVIFNRAPEPIWLKLMSGILAHRVETVTYSSLQKSMRLGLRELGKFEHQLFAMNRLRLEGERALALIGTLSLLEWYLNLHFPGASRKQDSVGVLVKTGRIDFIPEPLRALLAEANQLRNRLVHGSPPSRHSLTSPHASAGRENEYQGNIISSEKVEQVIRAALEVFRLANLRRQGRN
jgi:hypothetical protein